MSISSADSSFAASPLICTANGEPRRERSVGVGEVGDEQRVDSRSAFRRVEVGKGQSVGEVRHGGRCRRAGQAHGPPSTGKTAILPPHNS